MRVRDPIHGTIPVEDCEVPLIDSAFFQRLRHVKQLGFGELAFPGATHTRHAHSLGAMHVATRLFDAVFARATLGAAHRARLRQAVRVAALCHDLGHMPLSHASEGGAPPRQALHLPDWVPASGPDRATHEDFTARLLLDSSLTPLLEAQLRHLDIRPQAVAALVLGGEPPGGPDFVVQGLDWTPLLRQLVSGELDGDRMDYLLRDSFYTGVNYGRFDLDWVVQNLMPLKRDGRVYLALSNAAIFAFEDFLLSRFHMFMSVYFHHTSVGFDEMLRRYYAEEPGALRIPADPEAFLGCDDVALLASLRQSDNRWARRIVARQGFKRVAQASELDRDYDVGELSRVLREAGIEHFTCESVAALSRYDPERGGPPLFVVDPRSSTTTPISEYTPLYRRYSGALRMTRLYCPPEDAERARALVAKAVRRSHEQRLAGARPPGRPAGRMGNGP